MLPQVENFITVQYNAQQEFKTEYRKIRDVLYYEDRQAFSVREVELMDIRDKVVRVAWDAMKTADDKLVHFIVDNCWEHREDQAMTVLAMMPCSLETIDLHARKYNWCDEYEEFVDRARESGVLGGATFSPERIELYRYLRKDLSLSRDVVSNIMKTTDKVIAAEAVKVDGV